MSGELDIITLRGLTARGNHGVFPAERQGSQPFSADVSVWVDTRAAATGDDIDLTVSYADIADQVHSVLTGEPVYLLETLAQRIAEVVLAHPRVAGVEVTVHKPMAPIRHRFSDVSVTIRRGLTSGIVPPAGLSVSIDEGDVDALDTPERGDAGVHVAEEVLPAPVAPARRVPATRDRSTWSNVVLALGGNVGDVPTTLSQVVGALLELPGLEVDEVSPLVRTKAVLAPDQDPQDDYWNAVVLARMGMEPRELLAAISQIEADLGRTRGEHWGPRTVDIDIIQIQGFSSDSDELFVPHPRARSRAFVLVPWELVDPQGVLEGVGRVDVLAQAAPDRAGILDAVSDWLEDPGSVIAESNEVLADRPGKPVFSTPSGASVVVSTPAAKGQSRVDRVPESTRTQITPSEAGGDVLWRQLWDDWQTHAATGMMPIVETQTQTQAQAQAAQSAPAAMPEVTPHHPQAAVMPQVAGPVTPPVGSAAALELAQRWREATVTTSRSDGTAPGTRQAAPSSDEPTATRIPALVNEDAATPASTLVPASEPKPAQAPGSRQAPSLPRLPQVEPTALHSPQVPTPVPNSPGAASRPAGSTPRRRAPQWVPVRAGAQAGTAAQQAGLPHEPAAPEGATPVATQPSHGAPSPSLPVWNFPSNENARIVDDPSELSPASARPTAAPVKRASILQPNTQVQAEPRPDDQGAPTSLVRGVTIRPTVTGQQEVKRRGTKDQS